MKTFTKKTMMVLAMLSMVSAANATIFRVSNITGSSAPYSTIAAAHDAASDGDTIMVDSSPNSYGDITLGKSVVLIGPGYWLIANNIAQEGNNTATIGNLEISGEGAVVEGMTISGLANIKASKVIIKRCLLNKGTMDKCITFGAGGTSHCVIHQNYIYGQINTYKNDAYQTSYLQITNNIFIGNTSSWDLISKIDNGYIAYNIFVYGRIPLPGVYNTTFERNIIKSNNSVTENNNNTITDNFVWDAWEYKTSMSDIQMRDVNLPEEGKAYGPFAGNDPYVISGIPAGPYIEDITMPTTVELGSSQEVTVKIGVVQ